MEVGAGYRERPCGAAISEKFADHIYANVLLSDVFFDCLFFFCFCDELKAFLS